MFFNSLSYLAFLLLTVCAYWAAPVRARTTILLVGSILFYGLWRIEFVVLIMFSAFVDFFFSLRIYAQENPRYRRLLLIASVSINMALLLYFKYTYFIVDNLALIALASDTGLKAWLGQIILPLGISFYTFLSISYTVDVYRREYEPVRSFQLYLTYVMFWPHMIAGPILRAHELLPQLVQAPRVGSEDIAFGLRTILFGLFLKVGGADQIAPLIDAAFVTPPAQLGGLDVWTMAFGFGLQIYFDFAGYSMIAIGSARLIGIRFPDNFNWPYVSSNPREFWRRWHITLSSWIRDYLYLPLSGIRQHSHSTGGIDVQFVPSTSAVRTAAALFVTWFIMGLWHGASWNFALWGIWHATIIFVYRLLNPYLPTKSNWFVRAVGWAVTTAVVMLAWIPFRAPTLGVTFELWSRVIDLRSYRGLGFRETTYLFIALVFAGMLAMHWASVSNWSLLRRPLMRQAGEFVGIAVAVFIVFIFLRPVNQFIYFQF